MMKSDGKAKKRLSECRYGYEYLAVITADSLGTFGPGFQRTVVGITAGAGAFLATRRT
jgi:hypothetical protein